MRVNTSRYRRSMNGSSYRQNGEQRVLNLDGQGNAVEYYLLIEGDAADLQSGQVDQFVDSIPNTPYTYIAGFVRGGVDSYGISGRIVDFRVGEGDVIITLDGTDISANPQQIVESPTWDPDSGSGGNGGNGGAEPESGPNIALLAAAGGVAAYFLS